MPLPYSFLLGLFCLFGAPDLVADLPHDVSFRTVAPYLPLVFLPWLVSRVLSVRVPRPDTAGRRLRIRINHVLQVLAVPAAYFALLVFGEFGLWVDDWLPSVEVVRTAVKMIPLLVMEYGVNRARRQAARQLLFVEAVIGPAPFHFTLVAFLSVLVLLFVGSMDLIALHRGLYVFVVSTALGNLLWIFAFIAVLCVLLPFVFRIAAKASPGVPTDSREVAVALGFPASRVLLLGTDRRLINAMLVGPVPGFRYLFLTDGLVELLDPLSLRGVVAHEVGHARANHPLLLLAVFGVVPLCLFYPLDVLGVAELDPVVLAVMLAVGAWVGFQLVRRLAHRFELEADLISADVLGGSAPCVLALHKVSQLNGPQPGRDSLRHPSEERRILHLLSCEGDPWFRERFDRRGRHLRRAVAAGVLAAFGLGAWAMSTLWPVDKLVLQYFTGDFPGAQRTLAAMPAELPPGRRELVDQLGEELAAARTILPDGGAWNDIREELAARALVRAQAELLRNGPRTARPWYSIAVTRHRASKLEWSLYLYCDAVANDDRPRADELRDHMLGSFDLDPELRRALSAGRGLAR